MEGFGFSEFNDEEELQLSIADEFLTWGWNKTFIKLPRDIRMSKIIPLESFFFQRKVMN